MIKYLKKYIKKKLYEYGYEIKKNSDIKEFNFVELSEDEINLVKKVYYSKYSMTSVPRLVATLKACKYVVDENIDGDFVECGVWRGGNAIIAKKIFEKMGSKKKLYLFDTFTGMTEPSEFDKDFVKNEDARDKYFYNQEKNFNKWCYASIDDVKKNIKDICKNIDDINFIKGDVKNTLQNEKNLPKKISVLRLDTDWYESTLIELKVLYPLLSLKGSLVIDDYGHWQGSKKAVDEYFKGLDYKPLLNITDYTGRSAIKY